MYKNKNRALRVWRIIFILVCVAFYSCTDKRHKRLVFPMFSLEVPHSWQKINLQGIDSYVSGIVIGENKDTIKITYGKNALSFNEEEIVVVSQKEKLELDSLGIITEGFFVSKTPEVDYKQAIFLGEYYLYDTIDGRLAKIRIPKDCYSNYGRIGVCFLKNTAREKTLTLYSEKVECRFVDDLIKAFRTIKFSAVSTPSRPRLSDSVNEDGNR